MEAVATAPPEWIIMLRRTAQVLGILVGVLALAGFFVEGSHLLGIMNVDLTLDVLRVIIAGALLYVGFANSSASTLRTAIIVVGAMYVLMGVLAIFDPTLFGLLPTGFTGFDIGFHIIVGIGALALALVPMSDTGARGANTRIAR